MAAIYLESIFKGSDVIGKRYLVSNNAAPSMAYKASLTDTPPVAGFYPPKVAIVDNMDGTYVLEEDLTYIARDGSKFIVPKGFVTDFGSIPRAFWIIPGLQPIGSKMDLGYILHDYLHEMHRAGKELVDRATADSLLEEAGEVMDVGWLVCHTVWFGVRMGGWYAWGHGTASKLPV